MSSLRSSGGRLPGAGESRSAAVFLGTEGQEVNDPLYKAIEQERQESQLRYLNVVGVQRKRRLDLPYGLAYMQRKDQSLNTAKG